MTTLSYPTSQGGTKTVEIIPTKQGRITRHTITVTADGISEQGSLDKLFPARTMAGTKITHHCGRIAFSEAQASEILAEIARLDAEAKALYDASPEGIEQALLTERKALSSAISGATLDGDRAGERAWERGDADGWGKKRQAGERKAEEARAKLAEFDAAHPEILVKIQEERAVKAARREANAEANSWR